MAIEYIEYGDNGRVARDIINNMLSEVESHIPSIGENGHWYIGGVDTGITARGVELRVLNNLMKVNEEQKTYVDLQMASGITPEDDLEVGVTVGRISSVDGWNQSGIMLNWQTTAGEYVRLISGDDGKIYLDGGNGTWQQIYNKSDIDGLFQTLRNELSSVAFSGDFNDLQNKPTIGDATLTIQKNGTAIDTFTANATVNKAINITVPTATSDIDNDSGFIDKTVDDLENYTKTSDLASVATSGDYDDLINTPSLSTVATSGSYDDLTDKPTIGTATLTIQKNGTKIDDFSANATSNKTINVTVPTKTSDISNDSGYITKAVADLDNYTPTSSLGAVALSNDYTDLDNKPTIPTNVSDLNNDSGFIDKDVDDLTNYTKTSDLPTVGTATITVQKNGTKVDDFSVNATSNKNINITMSKTDVGLGNVDNTSDANKPISTATQTALNAKQDTIIAGNNITINNDGKTINAVNTTYTAGANIQINGNNEISATDTVTPVVDNLTSTSTTSALSANQGRLLDAKIADLQAMGKFLSLWDGETGLPISFPHQIPYTYSTGDYFLVESVDTTTNYRPTGSSYNETASTVVETDEVEIGDMYIYDGNVWLLQINHGKSVSFANLSGEPTDNTALANTLGDKADVSSLATVATSGSYNDLTNKPTIPSAQIQSDWTQADNTKKDYIKNKPTFSAVATSGSYNDLSNKPTIPTATSDLTNDSGYITSSDIPTNVSAFTNDSGYLTSASLPTVNNKKITIQKNGTKVDDFTLNQSTDKTINIAVPTKTSDITNDSGFITKSVNDLTNYTLSTALSEVATSGAYSDLTGTPTIPADTSDLTNGAGFITSSDLSNGSGISISGTTISNSGVLSVNGNTGAVTVSEFAPGTGTTGQVVTKTATGYAYASIPSQVSDTAYASSWNGVTGTAPSKNAVYDKISAMDTTIAGKADSSSLATVATTGAYSDLTGTPTIPTVNNATLTVTQNGTSKGTFTANASSNVTIEVKDTTYESKTASSGGTAVSLVTTGEKYTWNNKQDTISDLATIRSGASAGATAVQPGDLATVATTGAYSDLTGKPTIPTVNNAKLTIQKNGTTVKTFTANASSNVTANITVPTKVSDLTNDSGYITKSVSDLTNYTPTTSLATVATSGSYNDLSNKPTIPSVNNSTITFTQGGVSKGTITTNQSSASTIALDVGGVSSVNGKTGAVSLYSSIQVTLTSSGWSNNTQTVSVTGVTASNTVIVSPAPSDIGDYADCGVYCSAQGSGTLTFGCDTAPSGDIVVNVLIMS